jgi:hypothetical protein
MEGNAAYEQIAKDAKTNLAALEQVPTTTYFRCRSNHSSWRRTMS